MPLVTKKLLSVLLYLSLDLSVVTKSNSVRRLSVLKQQLESNPIDCTKFWKAKFAFYILKVTFSGF